MGAPFNKIAYRCLTESPTNAHISCSFSIIRFNVNEVVSGSSHI